MDFSLKSLVQVSNLDVTNTIKKIIDKLNQNAPVTQDNILVNQDYVSLINCILEPKTAQSTCDISTPTGGSTVEIADDRSGLLHLDPILAKTLIHEYCLPTLVIVSPLSGSVPSYKDLSNSLCGLIERICHALPKKEGVLTANALLKHCTCSLDIVHRSTDDPILPNFTLKNDGVTPLPAGLPFSIVVNLCNKVVKFLLASKGLHVDVDKELNSELRGSINLLSNSLIELIALESEKNVVKLCSVLGQLIHLQSEKKNAILSSIWTIVKDKSDIQKAFAILCALADYFLPVISSETPTTLDICIVTYASFWKLVQAGIPHKNTLVRKRSLYLLKRIVDIFEHGRGRLVGQDSGSRLFWWDASEEKRLMTVWQDFMLLIEMLEESQIHVIRPLFPRLKLLEAATHEANGPAYLHTSWLLTLLQRTLNHDSLYLMKWGLENLLDIDCTKCPIFKQDQCQFFYNEFLVILNESLFFSRPPGTPAGSCPPVAMKLAHFLQCCVDAQRSDAEKCQFIKEFLLGMKSLAWNGVSLMFVCRALSELASAPLLDQECVFVFRHIVMTMITTVEVRARGAIQCFLLRAIMKLSNLDEVSPDDVMNFIGVVKSEESYRRGSPLWQDTVKWLIGLTASSYKAWSRENLLKVLRTSIAERMKTATLSDLKGGCSASGEAKFVLLLLDADVISIKLTAGEASFDGVMFPILDVLSSAATRLYMPREKADEALHILVCLLKEMGKQKSNVKDKVRLKVEKVLEPTRKDILDYISLRLLTEIKDIVEIPIQSLCVSSLELLSSMKPDQTLGDQLAAMVTSCVHKLETKHAQSTLDVIIQSYGAIQTMATIARVIQNVPSSDNRTRHLFHEAESNILAYVKRNKITAQLPKLALKKGDAGPKAFNENTDMGWLISNYMMYQWQVIHFCQERSGVDDVSYVANDCLNALDTGSSVVNLPVFKCLKIILPKVLKAGDDDLVVTSLKAAWSSLLEFRRDGMFWPAYDCFVAMCFQDPLLLAAKDGTALLDTMMHFCDEIFRFGEERNGIVNVFSSYLCRFLLQDDNMKHSGIFVKHLARAALFGTVHNRHVRFFHDAFAYINTIKDLCPSEESITSLYTSGEDHEVRVHIINLLCSLNPTKPYHSVFIKAYMKEMKRIQKETMSVTKYRHFPNTLQHREAHRLVGTLVVMEPYVEQDDVDEFLRFLTVDLLVKEVQPSVCYLIELIIVRVFLRFPSTLHTLWDNLKQSHKMRPALMCSWLCILSQMVAAVDAQEDQESFFMEAIPLIFPLCMAHQFNLRIYAQSIMLRMWQMCEEKSLSKVMEKYQIIEAIKKLDEASGNSRKTSKKLLDHFLFKIHPLKDYSMKTIFETLPRLSDIVDDEWLTPEMFIATNHTWSDQSAHMIPLYPQREDLQHAAPGTWKVKAMDDDDDASGPSDGDVQRKITPWKTMLPDDEVQEEMVFMNKPKIKDGLVLVASLINKAPNLGGLCRTSEVFGVSQFVLGSLNYLNDKMFQSLSVTSEKWVPIREVAPHLLIPYLSEMRNNGYTLIGVEQTANSVCMTQYTFQEKSLLLLGNEKGGIPVELIQHLDVCVEIPQQGVIRSLNVHVSGALLVWEYRRQQLLKSIV